jgi:hypothetical protein
VCMSGARPRYLGFLVVRPRYLCMVDLGMCACRERDLGIFVYGGT